ncbi:hypothetical protein BOX15_Mlig032787g4 [Macrostomum lignano]|uniref:3-hydroxyacyl-CoA dehydrogenase type-2 n=1 Tax=Macrostomum lignano TaxID=282301 RepID=A0A267DRE7_9PLAT|nr:hypothetical protein BOX15_Mlig032787g4 [Macrostomum lignano]
MTALLKSVTGLRVMVTGGASGLGATTATQLLNRGARVLIVDVAESNPTTNAGFCRADITDESGVASAMSVAEKQLGGLDAVVNCAGEGLAARMYNWNNDTVFNQDDFRRLLQVNALGTFNVCRLAAQLMAKNQPAASAARKDKKAAKKAAAATDAAQRGVIVNTSSLSAFDGQATQTMYSASKAAVAAMTLPLSRDLAPLGIRVCCIAPGYFDSPMCVRDSYPAPGIEVPRRPQPRHLPAGSADRVRGRGRDDPAQPHCSTESASGLDSASRDFSITDARKPCRWLLGTLRQLLRTQGLVILLLK